MSIAYTIRCLQSVIEREEKILRNRGSEAVQINVEDEITLDDLRGVVRMLDAQRVDAAKAALTGFCANPTSSVPAEMLALAAVKCGDALLAELAKERQS